MDKKLEKAFASMEKPSEILQYLLRDMKCVEFKPNEKLVISTEHLSLYFYFKDNWEYDGWSIALDNG